MPYLYLLVNFFTVIIPFAFSFHPKLRFYKQWKAFFIANLTVAAVFIAWDILFTHLGVWGFNPDHITGLHLFNLPVEEVLFFICIPYACVFTYHCLTMFYNFQWKQQTENVFVYTLALLLLVIGIAHYHQLYTASTFISLTIVLFVLKLVFNMNWLSKPITVYAVLLLPFFIVNGILTGFGLEEPVVWYDDTQNLGIRLFTIPIEDAFYGFELILLNVVVFEWLRSKL